MASSGGPPSVDKPVDRQKKDEDINRKLQFYGIAAGFRNGKLPSNDQIDVALNSFLRFQPIARPPKELSSEGQNLVADFAEVVRQAKYLVLAKNEGNLFQEFVWETMQFKAEDVKVPDAPVDQETARKHGEEALQGLRTLGTLLITNGQFRKILRDATLLFRDIASDAATTAATRLRPSQEDMAQIDEPAAGDTWHDAPDVKNLKKQVQGYFKGAGGAAQASRDSGAAAAREQRAEGATAGESSQAAARAAQDATEPKLKENAPEETREAAKTRTAEYRARGREYFSKKMPEERRERAIWRLKRMVMECQQRDEYHEAIETLLSLAEVYAGHTRSLAGMGGDTAKQTRSAFDRAEVHLKTLIERFANGTSTDGFWESLDTIYKDAEKDDELMEWFRSIGRYIRRCLQEEGYVISDPSTDDGRKLYDRGNYLLREKYRSHTNRVVDELRFLAEQFDQDPQNKAFGDAMRKLFTDLGNDETGRPVFKPHLVKDLTDVIVPGALENVAYIPVPRIEFSDPQMDVVVENLVLESENFVPNVLEVYTSNYFRWGRKRGDDFNRGRSTTEVSVKGVQLDLRDVSYHIRKKQGFPSLTDAGIADVLLSGDGFCFKIKMSTADPKDDSHFFKVDKVDVEVKHLKVRLRQSKHRMLFNIFRPIMFRLLRPAIQKAAEKAIREQTRWLDALLFEAKQEVDEQANATAAAGGDSERAGPAANARAQYSGYLNVLFRKVLEARQRTASKMADKKTNLAVTAEESIFPDVHLPGGISSKATEYRDLAQKGDRWESPVFSIGNAEKTTDAPHAPEIERKPLPAGRRQQQQEERGSTAATTASPPT